MSPRSRLSGKPKLGTDIGCFPGLVSVVSHDHQETITASSQELSLSISPGKPRVDRQVRQKGRNARKTEHCPILKSDTKGF